MVKLNKEVKIGITVTVAFVFLAWGLNFLKGRDVFKGGDKYYGVYTDVSGLNEASPIFFKGFKVGSVRNIELHPDQPGKLLVTFLMVKDISFPSNSLARIYSLDLMGSKGVELVAGDSPDMLQPFDTIRTSVVGDLKDQLSMEVLPLKEKTEKLMVRMDSLLINISLLFTEENRKNLGQAIAGFNSTMNNAKNLSHNLERSFDEGGEYYTMMARIDSILYTLNRQAPYIDSTFANLSGFSNKLNSVELEPALTALKISLEEAAGMIGSVNDGDGSLGMLMTDKELYYNLADASANLNRLLMDVRHQPGKYVNFSAVDLGKKVYVDVPGGAIEGVVFQVKILESKHPVHRDSLASIDEFRIFEDFDGRRFYYSIGQSKDYENIQKVLLKAQSFYPKSEVIALENGRLISLNKALRRNQK